MEKFVYGFLVLIAMLIVKSTTRVGYLCFLVFAACANTFVYFFGDYVIANFINFSYVAHASLFAVLFATIMRESYEYKQKVDN